MQSQGRGLNRIRLSVYTTSLFWVAAGVGVLVVCPSIVKAAPNFDPVAATEAYLNSVPETERLRSNAYFEGGYWIQLWGFLIGIAMHLALLLSGVSVRMRDLAKRLVGNRNFLVSLGYWLQYLVLSTVILFPWNAYVEFFREHQYGLATHDFAAWFGEQMKIMGLLAVFGALFVAGLLEAIRRWPKTWWKWGTTGTVLLMSVTFSMAPVFLMPIFNRYEPLEDGPVKEAVLKLAKANGLQTDEVWKNDASKQSTRISAHVSGMFGTERITLNDNLLNAGESADVEAVMGHEIGHYVLNHVYESIVYLSGLILIAFLGVQTFARRLLGRFGKRWKVHELSDPAAFPVLMIVLSSLVFLGMPVLRTIVRSNEAEADLFGLNAARQPDGFARTALMLRSYRKLDPSPLEELLFFDHPSGRARIRMAMEWKAAHFPDAQMPRFDESANRGNGRSVELAKESQ